MTIQELREQRAELTAKQRAILDAAKAEGRPLNTEERSSYDAHEAAFDQATAELQDLEASYQAMADCEDALSKREADLKKVQPRRTEATQPGKLIVPAKGGDGADQQAIYREAAVNAFLSHGWNGMTREHRANLQVDVDNIGGTLVLPIEFVQRLIKFVDDRLYMRSICTVLPLTDADDIGAPSWDTDPADADWTSELGTGGEDSSARTGRRLLHPNPVGKRIKVSRTLLRKSVIPAEQLVRERLGYKFAVTEEKAFLTGTGANQPLGVFTAHNFGIPTGRDVSTGNTQTAVTADGLINAKFFLKSQYMASPNARWLFHRTVVRDIRKLKDGNGQYIWQAGLAGTPDSILEVPYFMSEFAPNTMTSGLYVGIIGDFTWYWIAESLKFELQRLDELYAASNEVGFIGRQELDGAPVLAEAFARVTLA